jgi:hypothetical protein
MARTTTDPKPEVLTLRLSARDVRDLARLAKRWDCSRSEAVRRLLRAATRKPKQ